MPEPIDRTAPTPSDQGPGRPLYTPVKAVGLVTGLGMMIATWIVPEPEGLSPAGWCVVGVGLLMAIWWASEAIPISATALVPLIALPMLDIVPVREAAAAYANPLVFLFLGGFIIGRALQRWDLHRRIALTIAAAVGTRPDRLILGFMLATAFLSMWVSNTATAVMMVPIAASVIAVVQPGDPRSPQAIHFGAAMMLGVAYAASIGGAGTLIGTPPNAFLAAFMLQTYDFEVTFASWALFAMPVVAVLLPVTWLVLTRVVYPESRVRADGAVPGEGRGVIRDALASMGPLTTAEARVGIVFAAVAIAWIIRPWLAQIPGLGGLSDPVIGMLGALALFLLPAGKGEREAGRPLLTWEDAERLPWGVLVLFGGGLSLAGAIGATDLADWLGEGLRTFEALPLILFIAVVTLMIIMLTELTSNVATTAAFLPVVTALAVATGNAPLDLGAPAALAASCAFMLPVATPPNAVVFSSGHVTIQQMIRAGIVMNIIAASVIVLAGTLLVPLVFG